MTDDSVSQDLATMESAVDRIQKPDLSAGQLSELRAIVFGDSSQLESLRSWINEQPSSSRARAVGLWVIGRHESALEALKGIPEDTLTRALMAACDVELAKFDSALQRLGDPADAMSAGVRAQALVRSGNEDAVRKTVASPGPLSGTAWQPFLEGWIAERELRGDVALIKYSQAWEQDTSIADLAFHYARLLELKGMDEEALEVYEDALERVPPNHGMLSNLGLLYEDLGEWARAEACFKAVLRADPQNERARLFLGDVEASKYMQYDEDQERREDKRNAILRTPVTDFELSVRSRNCLSKMGIRTLGDLVQKTEAELLSYKNFGETSLMEIQQILQSKNLRLGMTADELTDASLGQPRQVLGDQSDPRNRPITELELSVRSRRVVEMFKLRIIGDLANKTEAELMACPNFGQTSLNEIKSKLDEYGLGLKG